MRAAASEGWHAPCSTPHTLLPAACPLPAPRSPRLLQSLQWLRHGCLPVIVMEGTAPLEKRGAQQARHESRFGQPGGGSQAGRANTQFQRLGRLVGSLLQVLLLLHCVLRGISPAGCCARRPSPVCWLPRCMKLAHVCGTRVVHGPATVLLLVLLVPCWFPGFCCLASPPTSLPYTMFSHMRTLLHPRHPRPGPAVPTIWPPTTGAGPACLPGPWGGGGGLRGAGTHRRGARLRHL